MAQQKIFQPVRGTENAISKIIPRDNYVYFAYDTGNIYVDKAGARYPMGKSNGIIYANGNDENIVNIITADEETTKDYDIFYSALEDPTIRIRIDNLILNSDGRFFRVKEVQDNKCIATLLSISSSGGNSGGGGTLIGLTERIKIVPTIPESSFVINGKTAIFKFYARSGQDLDDGSYLDNKLTVHWSLAEKLPTGKLETYATGTLYDIDASTREESFYIELEYGSKARPSTENVLTITAEGVLSKPSVPLTYNFNTTELRLSTHDSFNNLNIFADPTNINITCSTFGQADKAVYYYFESNGEMVPLNENNPHIVESGDDKPDSYKVPTIYATHGAHKIRIEMYLYLIDQNKVDKTAFAEPIEMEIGIQAPNHDSPVIWFGDYKNEYYQYDSIKIPVRVVDPKNQIEATVRLFKDSTLLNSDYKIKNETQFHIWEIINTDLDMMNYYSISCGVNENETRREISFKVLKDPNRLNMKTATNKLRYTFDARGRSQSESAATRDKYINNGIEAIFENFNWYNNGWITDKETGDTCLRISNGAKLTIPIGETIFAGTADGQRSHTFEFQFKVRNVSDYSPLIRNLTRYKGNTVAKHGPTYDWQDEAAYRIFTDKSYMIEYISADAFNTGINYYTLENGKYILANEVDETTFINGTYYIKNPLYREKAFDNYDAFLSWFLPLYSINHPECPPTYDDLEFDRLEKILSIDNASGSYLANGKGIAIGAQEALFTNGTNTVNVSYIEDKLINLTIVYSDGRDATTKLMFIYLNGMLTGVSKTDSSINTWSIASNNIIFDSKNCDFDLYKIRIYNDKLDLAAILTNYMVDLRDPIGYDLTQLSIYNQTLEESQLVYKNMIDYNLNHPDGYIMPYIIFTTKPNQGNKLPYNKDVPIVDTTVEFVNTGLERAYINGELNSLAQKSGKTVEDYYIHHCPSFKAEHTEMKVQGTSSEFYPRKNFKLKTKCADDPYDLNAKKKVQMYMNRGPFAEKYLDQKTKEETHLDWFYMDNDTVGTTKFTLKIDYMESSGTYNMGFANLVNNAYTHHPYYDYIQAGAFQKEITNYTPIDTTTETYDDTKTYYYKNHNNNMKNTDEDDLKIIHSDENPALAFSMGPSAYGASKGISKVSSNDNQWYTAEIGYEDYTLSEEMLKQISDLRTSVQGFPALAFHQKTDVNGEPIGSPIFIGRYNIMLDKGSDEAYGFKMDNVYQKYVTKKNKPQKISKVAECWEGENNSRGFCSFRDPEINRQDDKFFDTGKLNAYGAPIIADYWEYRYHDKGDSLDVFYKLDEKLTSADAIATVEDECGFALNNTEQVTCPDNSYFAAKNNYTQGMKDAGDTLLNLYANWERAVKWVWSTDLDSVPSGGRYIEIDVGTKPYEKNKYFILSGELDNEGNSIYIIDQSDNYDDKKIYYINDSSTNEKVVIKLFGDDGAQYEANKYYTLSDFGDYVLDRNLTLTNGVQYYKFELDPNGNGAIILDSPQTYNGITYNYDTKEYRNAKFVNELEKHFNLEYLATYFVMTEVFECYDSRGKNMMMASWGPLSDDPNSIYGNDYIWYPIFYDIDTQLGINNTGIPSFEYYVDATIDGVFSTNDSVLFNNFYRNFKSSIIQKYRQLRGNSSDFGPLPIPPLTSVEGRIEKWYTGDPIECNSIAMRGERPLIAFNLDAYYKYITITNAKGERFLNTEGENADTDGGTYFYMLQGDRSLSRQQFLNNRLNYIDSWLTQGTYTRGATNSIAGRVAANNPIKISDKWIEGTNTNGATGIVTDSNYWKPNTNDTIKNHIFDAEYWINLTPAKNSYVTVGTDAANFPSLKYNGNTPVYFKTTDLETGVRTSGRYNEQLYYIYGIDQMKSMGDISKLYWTEFRMNNSAPKMVDLLLGYDGIDEEGNYYYNGSVEGGGLNDYSLKAETTGNSIGMPLLQRVNLSGLYFKNPSATFNFNSSEKLEDFRAINSNIKNVTFADGVALHTLYLPNTVSRLELIQATHLNNIVTEFRPRNDLAEPPVDVYRGLYIADLTDKTPDNAQSNIQYLSLIGDSLGYDSYTLLNNYYEARKNKDEDSQINLTDVNWSPYEQLTKGYEYNENEQYYIDNGHYSFDEYTGPYTLQSWNLAIANGKIYKLNQDIENTYSNRIKTIDLLINLKENTHFKGISLNSEVPNITGIIYVNNDEDVNEKTIEQELGLFYPHLKLFFKNIVKVPTAKYVILNDDGTQDELATRRLGDNDDFFPMPFDLINLTELQNYDTRNEYDFYGWSIKPLSPADVEALIGETAENGDILTDENWYLDSYRNDTGLVQTTTNINIIPAENQYDYWDTQEHVEEQSDYTFYAVYYIHKYKMTFYNGDNTELQNVYVPANKSIFNYWPLILPVKEIEDTEENFSLVNKFIGWAFSENGRVERINDANLGRANKDRKFYPIFEKDDVHNNVLYDQNLLATNNYYYTISANGILNFKTTANVLKGKITLPTHGYSFEAKKDVDITAINQFGSKTSDIINPEITHIFWETGRESQLMNIGTYAFAGWKKLQYVELPQYNIKVNVRAFSRIPFLFKNVPINNFIEFFRKISVINNGGFYQSGWYQGTNTLMYTFMNKDIKLDNINTIEDMAFANLFGNFASDRTSQTFTLWLGSENHPDVDYTLWTGNISESQVNITSGICYNDTNATYPIEVHYYKKNNNKDDITLKEEIASLCDRQNPGNISVEIHHV